MTMKSCILSFHRPLSRGGWLRLVLLLAAVALLLVFLFTGFRLDIAVRQYTQRTAKVPAPLRLVVVADLHSSWYGEDQAELLALIAAQQPDALVLVGDIVDDKRPREGADAFLRQIGAAYPCYYVAGNHEFWSDKAGEIKAFIRSCGIRVLEGEADLLRVGEQAICIAGVDDPDVAAGNDDVWQLQLEACRDARDDSLYTVLLSHRPERVDAYAESGFDLVLCGHAHGGQVRIPGLVNGLYAPDQGLFPAYAGGEYRLGATTMIVSRGLSKKLLPRVYNRPELVVVDILPPAVSADE